MAGPQVYACGKANVLSTLNGVRGTPLMRVYARTTCLRTWMNSQVNCKLAPGNYINSRLSTHPCTQVMCLCLQLGPYVKGMDGISAAVTARVALRS